MSEYVKIDKQKYVNLLVVEENYKYLLEKHNELLKVVKTVIDSYEKLKTDE